MAVLRDTVCVDCNKHCMKLCLVFVQVLSWTFSSARSAAVQHDAVHVVLASEGFDCGDHHARTPIPLNFAILQLPCLLEEV